MSKYAFGKTVNMDFEEAMKAVTEALAKEGFGVLTESSARRLPKLPPKCAPGCSA